MLTKEERIAVVSARLCSMTYEQMQADFARKFRKPGPTRLAIKNLVNKFRILVVLQMKSIQGDRPYQQIQCKMYRMRSLAALLHQPGDLADSWVFLKPLSGELSTTNCTNVHITLSEDKQHSTAKTGD